MTFPVDLSDEMKVMQIAEEMVFIFDLILNFNTSYVDIKTFEVVRSHYKIAKNYLNNGWFFVDFLSVFPFQHILPDN